MVVFVVICSVSCESKWIFYSQSEKRMSLVNYIAVINVDALQVRLFYWPIVCLENKEISRMKPQWMLGTEEQERKDRAHQEDTPQGFPEAHERAAEMKSCSGVSGETACQRKNIAARSLIWTEESQQRSNHHESTMGGSSQQGEWRTLPTSHK